MNILRSRQKKDFATKILIGYLIVIFADIRLWHIITNVQELFLGAIVSEHNIRIKYHFAKLSALPRCKGGQRRTHARARARMWRVTII